VAECARDGDALELKRRLTTVVAADICGYSRLAEVNESAAIRTVHLVRAAFEQAAARRRGRIFHAAGDGFLAEFPSAADGVLAALDFVADIKARDALSPSGAGARVRVGVHSGDVVEQPNGDLLGHGVNIAARLQAEAEPNGVIASSSVVNLVRDQAGVAFQRRGPLALKNIGDPVQVFDVAVRSSGVPGLHALIGAARRARSLTASATFLLLVSSASAAIALLAANPFTEKPKAPGAPPIQDFVRKVSADLESEGDEVALLAAHDAAKSLLNSEVPAKRRAVEKINAGDLSGAIVDLQGVLQEQIESSTRASAQEQTLRELGAVAFAVDTKSALSAYQRLYELAPHDEIVLHQLGKLSARTSNANLAYAYFTALSRIAAPNSPMKLRAEAGAIDARISLNDLDGLESEIESALLSARRLRFAGVQAELLTAYAVLKDFQDDTPSMLDYQKQALVIESALGRPERLIAARSTYGAMLLEAKQHEEARAQLQLALNDARRYSDRQSEGSILYNLAYLELDLGNWHKAAEFARGAYRIAQANARPNLARLSVEVIEAATSHAGDAREICAHRDSASAPELGPPNTTRAPAEGAAVACPAKLTSLE